MTTRWEPGAPPAPASAPLTPAQPDPKSPPRIVDERAGKAKLRKEKRCRSCGRPFGTGLRLTRHHLVPKSRQGDDVDDNLVPLCGDGTTGCHGIYTTMRGKPEWHLVARSIRRSLTWKELRYVVTKTSAAWLADHYPIR